MNRFTHTQAPILGGADRPSGLRAHLRARKEKQSGLALVMTITTLAILAILLADMHESTSTAHAIATTQRDQLRAEYMAKSGLNLTRLLIGLEPPIRKTVAPMYQAMIGRPPPQLPIWQLATQLLSPFCDSEAAIENGINFGDNGLGNTQATCEITAYAENSKININQPLLLRPEQVRLSASQQMFALMGGYQAESPYDPLFANRDADGQFTQRLDVVSGIIDWWDPDTTRTVFDPGRNEVKESGGEDDLYTRLDDPYEIKNAPFDSIEELRLIRGVGDDFWATFVEPTQDDPKSRILTIYGSGWVNPNEAEPAVLLARFCSFVDTASLCVDAAEAAKFVQLLTTIRDIIPIPFFTNPQDFVNFLEGKGGRRDLYPMLQGFLGADSPLLFKPVAIPAAKRTPVAQSFVTSAAIVGIVVTGRSGRSKLTLETVMNFHTRWHPPPPNAGSLPKLGIFHYYRAR